MLRKTRSERIVTPAKRKHSELSEDNSCKSEVVEAKCARMSEDTVEEKHGRNQDLSNKKKTEKLESMVSMSKKFKLLLNKIEEISRKVSLGTICELTKSERLNSVVAGNKRHDFNEEENEKGGSVRRVMFSESPPFINGKMRDYQIRGLNWLISLRENNVNGILADEMGLGKTLQTISLLAYVKYSESKITGVENNLPSIIIVPLSTLHSWINEFEQWTNDMRVVVFHGDREKRRDIIENELVTGNYDIALTTYEMFYTFGKKLKKISWDYIIVDEAHRIKNEKAILSKQVREIKAKNKLLLTGTPLQNNLHELWSLLNFLQPDLFDNPNDFDSWFDTNECLANEKLVIQRMHKIIQPFILRRIKKDVEKNLLPKKETTLFVGLSNIQKELYKNILLKNTEIIINGRTTIAKLIGIMAQLRKVVSHPYLFPGVEPGPPYVEGEHLVKCCGKLNVLDKLLVKLSLNGSRVLIFCQFIVTLDIIEDYMNWKEYSYHRLDGSTSHTQRQNCIDEFQSKESKTFAFLISTRAGGLGITLTAADVVIFYDVDWNPQVDLQAADRVHRIGQTKEVKVFRIITEGTVDERIYEISEGKLRLDNLIIQKGRMGEMRKEMSKDDILKILRSGVNAIDNESNNQDDFSHDIEDIIESSSKKCSMLKGKIDNSCKSKGDFVIGNISQSDKCYSVYNFEGENYKILRQLNDVRANKEMLLDKRARKQRFEIQVENSEERKQKSLSSILKNAPFPPNYIPYEDYFLCDSEYIKLADNYVAYFRKSQNFSYIQSDIANISKIIQEKQSVIDNAKPLSALEIQKMNSLKKVAFFSNWNAQDFVKIKDLLASIGMDYEKIHSEMGNYDINEIKRYVSRLLRYAEENNMGNFLTSVKEVEKKRKRIDRNLFLKSVNKLFDNANGDPSQVNLSGKFYANKNSHGTTNNRNLELDKHIFHYFLSEIRENCLDLENISKEVILPFVTRRFLKKLKQNVRILEPFELTCDGVVDRFLSILDQIKNSVSHDLSTTNSTNLNDILPDKQQTSKMLLLKPCSQRNSMIKSINSPNNYQPTSSMVNSIKEIKINKKMLKTKANNQMNSFLSNNGDVFENDSGDTIA